jgi:hypothetical protein
MIPNDPLSLAHWRRTTAELYAGLRRAGAECHYADNPSCAYDDRWVCLLPPAENRLPFPIRAGEKVFACMS